MLADLVVDSLVRGGALAPLPIMVWLLIGQHRRHVLFSGPAQRRTVALPRGRPGRGPGRAAVGDDEETLDSEQEWQSLAEFLGPDVPIPEELDHVEVRGDVTTSQTRRLIESAVGTYEEGKNFYRAAAEAAADLDLRHAPLPHCPARASRG